jgi:thiamine biosynthesis lipoprotein
MPIPDAPRPAGLTRRQVIALGGGAFVLALTPALLRRRSHLVTRSIPVMGTIAEVVVVHGDRDEAERAIDLAFERLRWVDQTMSRFLVSSDIGLVNAGAGHDAVPVGAEVAQVVAEAVRWAEATDGLFDPGLARLMDVWDVANRQVPPPREAYARFAGRHLYRAITVDRFQGRPVIRLDNPEAAIDLGSIAKGYSVDLAIEALKAAGIRHAVVNNGGDLYAMGRSERGDQWRVGVRSARDPMGIEQMLELSDEAVATSGDYFQGFEYAHRRYHHLMDPALAEPRVTAEHSISIRADRCMTADAAATATFGVERTAADRLLQKVAPDARIVSTL